MILREALTESVEKALGSAGNGAEIQISIASDIGQDGGFGEQWLVVTEQVFNLNGLGQLFVDSVGQHDYALTQSLVMLVVAVFVFVNLFIDIVYGWLDPRIRYS